MSPDQTHSLDDSPPPYCSTSSAASDIAPNVPGDLPRYSFYTETPRAFPFEDHATAHEMATQLGAKYRTDFYYHLKALYPTDDVGESFFSETHAITYRSALIVPYSEVSRSDE